jgi:hypothetical protein
MCEDDAGFESFDEWVRSVAREISRSAERMAEFDIDEIAGALGVDASSARQWMDGAGQWLRSQFESAAGEAPPRPDAPTPGAVTQPSAAGADDPLRSAGPHPLDVPTDEQGLALSALLSGRWTIEPGSNALAARGDGPGPSDALGIVRELRVRDWITADGEVTPVGRHALTRWLDLAGAH